MKRRRIKFRRADGEWQALNAAARQFYNPQRWFGETVNKILEDHMAVERALRKTEKQAASELVARRRQDAMELALRARLATTDAALLVKEARIIEKYLAKG